MSIFSTFSSEDDFWAEFSVNNCRMSWTQLVEACKEKKRSIDKEDAKRAREQYKGDEFVENFSYRKGKEMKIFNKDERIARRYRELRDCPQSWDLD